VKRADAHRFREMVVEHVEHAFPVLLFADPTDRDQRDAVVLAASGFAE